MTDRVTILVGLVNKADTPVAAAGAASSLVDAYNSNPSSFELVNQNAQIAATLATVVSVAIANAPVGFLSVATNTFAGATVFLKIVVDVKNGKTIQSGDVLTLVSNVAAVAVTMTALATGAPALTAVTIGVLATGASFFASNVVQNIGNTLLLPLWEKYYKNTPSADYSDRILCAGMYLATKEELTAQDENAILRGKVDENSGLCVLETIDVKPDGGGSGGSINNSGLDYWWFNTWANGSTGGGIVTVGPIQPDDSDGYYCDSYM